MNDEKTGFTPLDPGRINVMDPMEFGYWCRELGCTPDQLRWAVAQAGEHVAAVRMALESRAVAPD